MTRKVGTLILLFFFVFGVGCEKSNQKTEKESEAKKEVETYYTCSMHPQVREDEPGKCPLCNMNLTKVTVDKGDKEKHREHEHEKASGSETWRCEDFPDVTSQNPGPCPLDGTPMVKKTDTGPSPGEIISKVRLRESQLSHFRPDFFPVSKMKMQKSIRLLGSVMSPEERESNIPARVGGRVEKVYIKSTGVFIGKGEPVVEFYSPKLISAGEEYLVARKNYRENSTETFKKMLEQSKERLRLWGVQKRQYEKWGEKGEVPNSITIYSPHSGIVKKRNAVAGKYFKEGQSLFDLVDLSQVWVEMDVYEADTALVEHGQEVELEFTALPGKIWSSKIDFVSPTINLETRTLKIRTTLENKEGELKPGMVAEGKLEVDLGDKKLVVPRTAVIDTGRRKVVWMKSGERTYRAKKIKTGHESHGYIQVISGLKEGDRVVMEGNFLLDAQSQLFGGYEEFNDEKNEEGEASPHQQH